MTRTSLGVLLVVSLMAVAGCDCSGSNPSGDAGTGGGAAGGGTGGSGGGTGGGSAGGTGGGVGGGTAGGAGGGVGGGSGGGAATNARDVVSGAGRISGGALRMDVQVGPGLPQQPASGGNVRLQGNSAVRR